MTTTTTPKTVWISKGRAGCKGNTWTELRGGLLVTTCDSCSLKWTTEKVAR